MATLCEFPLSANPGRFSRIIPFISSLFRVEPMRRTSPAIREVS